MARVRIFLAGLAGLALLSGSPAQALNGVFKGSKSARILVSELSPAGRACGLSKQALEAVVEGPLGATTLQFDAAGNPDFTFYVDVATVRTPGGGCVSNLAIRAANREDVKFTFSRIERSFPVILYERRDLLATSAASHADAVGTGLGRMVQEFAGDYDLDTRW